MQVGIVGMSVDQLLMNVQVGVRFAAVPGGVVEVPMVFVVHVSVCMLLLLMGMQMAMMFREVQPDAGSH